MVAQARLPQARPGGDAARGHQPQRERSSNTHHHDRSHEDRVLHRPPSSLALTAADRLQLSGNLVPGLSAPPIAHAAKDAAAAKRLARPMIQSQHNFQLNQPMHNRHLPSSAPRTSNLEPLNRPSFEDARRQSHPAKQSYPFPQPVPQQFFPALVTDTPSLFGFQHGDPVHTNFDPVIGFDPPAGGNSVTSLPRVNAPMQNSPLPFPAAPTSANSLHPRSSSPSWLEALRQKPFDQLPLRHQQMLRAYVTNRTDAPTPHDTVSSDYSSTIRLNSTPRTIHRSTASRSDVKTQSYIPNMERGGYHRSFDHRFDDSDSFDDSEQSDDVNARPFRARGRRRLNSRHHLSPAIYGSDVQGGGIGRASRHFRDERYAVERGRNSEDEEERQSDDEDEESDGEQQTTHRINRVLPGSPKGDSKSKASGKKPSISRVTEEPIPRLLKDDDQGEHGPSFGSFQATHSAPVIVKPTMGRQMDVAARREDLQPAVKEQREEWLASRFQALQENQCKDVLLAMISAIEPDKSRYYPYQSKRRDPKRPPWWPEHLAYGRGPHHMTAEDRRALLVHLTLFPLNDPIGYEKKVRQHNSEMLQAENIKTWWISNLQEAVDHVKLVDKHTEDKIRASASDDSKLKEKKEKKRSAILEKISAKTKVRDSIFAYAQEILNLTVWGANDSKDRISTSGIPEILRKDKDVRPERPSDLTKTLPRKRTKKPSSSNQACQTEEPQDGVISADVVDDTERDDEIEHRGIAKMRPVSSQADRSAPGRLPQINRLNRQHPPAGSNVDSEEPTEVDTELDDASMSKNVARMPRPQQARKSKLLQRSPQSSEPSQTKASTSTQAESSPTKSSSSAKVAKLRMPKKARPTSPKAKRRKLTSNQEVREDKDQASKVVSESQRVNKESTASEELAKALTPNLALSKGEQVWVSDQNYAHDRKNTDADIGLNDHVIGHSQTSVFDAMPTHHLEHQPGDEQSLMQLNTPWLDYDNTFDSDTQLFGQQTNQLNLYNDYSFGANFGSSSFSQNQIYPVDNDEPFFQ